MTTNHVYFILGAMHAIFVLCFINGKNSITLNLSRINRLFMKHSYQVVFSITEGIQYKNNDWLQILLKKIDVIVIC